MKKIITFFPLFAILILIGCEKKVPKSVQLKKEQEKALQSAKIDNKKLSPNESLISAIKNRHGLYPDYHIGNFNFAPQKKDLFILVNGADGTYISKGVIGGSSLELKHKLNNLRIMLTIFEIDKGKSAQDIYTKEKRGGTIEKIGSEGYFVNNNHLLIFWKERYYIKVELHDKTTPEKGKELLLQMGKRLDNII